LTAFGPSPARSLQPDLLPQRLELIPESPVEQGVVVRVSVILGNVGAVRAGEFSVELCWRRVDQEECSGFSRTVLPGLEAGAQATVEAEIDTADLTPGRYEISVRVDPEDRVDELDETNNRLTAELVILPPKPELRPISLSFEPPSPVPHGTTVRIFVEVENSGESTAGGFRVEFLYRRGGGEGEWTPFGALFVPGLKRAGRIVLEQPFDTSALELDPGAEITTFSIKVALDPPSAAKPDGEVVEQDETNNEIIASLGIVPSRLDLPELHPVSLTFNRDLPLEWGRDITATVLIVNTGGKKAEGIEVKFYYRRLGVEEWQEFATTTIVSLGIEEGNNSTRVDGRLDVPGLGLEPGSYQLRVVVDPGNMINEQNEANNEIVTAFFIQGSELLAQSLELGAAPVHQGDTITVTSVIKNLGKKEAKRFTVGFFIDDRRFDTFYYEDEEGLRQNETVKAQGKLDTTDLPCRIDPSRPGDPCGRFTLRVFVDPDDEIPELDETNNVISAPLVIFPPRPRKAELHPTSLVLDPPSPVRVGQAVLVTATIWNTGDIAAGRFQVELEISPDGQSWTPFAVQDIPGLPKGAKGLVEGQLITSGLAPGASYQIRVVVDRRDEVEELDENNNTLITALRLISPIVPPIPILGANLVLKEIILSPRSPVARGTQVQVCAEVANLGSGAAGEFRVEFLYRPAGVGEFVLFASRSVPGLEVSRSLTICEPFDTTGLALGSYEIKVVVDPENRVLELDEQDNELVRTLLITRVIPLPDLYPVGLSFDPPTPTKGELVQICVKIANLGRAPAGEFTVSYAYLLDDYVQFATATVPGLAAAGRIELCRVLDTSRLEPGSYEIRVRVDPDNRVAEQNETNNELSGYLTIIAPFPPTAQPVLQTGGPVRLLRLDPRTGAVYIGSEDGKLYALERGGALKAGFPFDAVSPIRALALDTGAPRAVYLGTAEGKLHAVRLETGREICQADLGGEVRTLGVDKFGNIYAGLTGRVVSLSSACETRWEFAAVGEVRALVVNEPRDAIYTITSTGLVYALGRDGTLEWQLDLQSPLSALALGEAIYIGMEDGRVLEVSSAGRPGWSFTAGGGITEIAVDIERRDPIYAASSDGRLYSLDLAGRLRW
ncbi:TPA: hypothetical protein EYP12_06830, partial [Candidatus Bipolaricaulota bacterium]|nr:hypothetical protein [Candidatus Bipolaricaulota bacterium]